MVFAEASFLISKLSTELLADELKDLDDLLEEELLRLLEDDLLEQLEFAELELELELENKPPLELDELLKLELEQLVLSGVLKGVVRSAPQPCNSTMDNKKNANALSGFDGLDVKLIIAL